MSSETSEPDDAWLRTPPTDSVEIASRYNDWAHSYEHDLVEAWNYEAPFVAAEMLAQTNPIGPILDIGCGTGLVGGALWSNGLQVVDGTDLSEVSLELAQTAGHYRRLTQHDFNVESLPPPDVPYGGAICVGVMSYAIDPIALIRDVCSMLVPGGAFVFTHRTDLWDAQSFDVELANLQEAGELSAVMWTEPRRYMPGNPEYADLRIRYVTALT